MATQPSSFEEFSSSVLNGFVPRMLVFTLESRRRKYCSHFNTEDISLLSEAGLDRAFQAIYNSICYNNYLSNLIQGHQPEVKFILEEAADKIVCFPFFTKNSCVHVV